jgi:uncharacterized DUF497 family protein
MEFPLRKQKLSLEIPFMLTSMIQIIPKKRSDILIIGNSERRRLLIVSYTERDDSMCLISAREVTRAERETYEEG